MSSNSKVTPDTRRRTLIGLAGLAASASALKTAWGAEPGPFAIKRASLLQRRPGISHEEFVKHWVEIHAPMARACPGIGRYALTIVKSDAQGRCPLRDSGGWNSRVVVQEPGRLRGLFKFACHQTAAGRRRNLHRSRNRFYDRGTGHHLVSPITRLLGAQNQLGFLGSGGHTGTAGTKPFRFGISIFGRLLASRTSLS